MIFVPSGIPTASVLRNYSFKTNYCVCGAALKTLSPAICLKYRIKQQKEKPSLGNQIKEFADWEDVRM